MMKIAIGVTYSYPYIGSGIGNVAMKQAEELAKRGHKVTLISSNFPKYKNRFVRNKVKYLKGNVLLRLEKIGLPIPLFFLTKEMKKAIRDADIVHIHDSLYPSSYSIAKYAKKFNKKIILTQHIGFVDYYNGFYRWLSRIVYKTISKKIFQWSNKILVLNLDVKENLKILDVDLSKIILIPNGVDTNLFKPIKNNSEKIKLRKKYNLPLNKPIVLFVGRLVGVKAFERLFEARDDNYLILFIGGGSIPEKMLDQENVLFLGEKKYDELVNFYQLSDIFVLPSKSEGFPLCVLESMSCGLPTIVSNLPIYSQYFKNSGLEVINPSSENIKNKIKELLENKNKLNKIGKRSREFIVNNFDWNFNINKLVNLYKEK